MWRRCKISTSLFEVPMFALSLRSANKIRHYSITYAKAAGWELRLEEDRHVRRLDYYRDWHQVERVLALLEKEVSDLIDGGWQIMESQQSPAFSLRRPAQ
jgi:hypothetical protein